MQNLARYHDNHNRHPNLIYQKIKAPTPRSQCTALKCKPLQLGAGQRHIEPSANHLPREDVELASPNVLCRVICKVTLCFTPYLPLLWPPLPPYPLFQWYPQSEEIFIKSWYEMLKLSHLMLKIIESNYSSCTGGSSAGAQEKGHTGWNSVYHQNWWNSVYHQNWWKN